MCAAAEPAPEESSPAGPVARFRAWFNKYAKMDKDSIKRLGVDAFFTYGCVSNLNAAVTVAIAWGAFSRASGLSPLAPNQWKPYLATYGAIYLTLGSLLRPFRIATAIGLTPGYSMIVKNLREKLPFTTSRPRLNRFLAVFIISILVNTAGTCLLCAGGACFAGFVTGVPAVPPGYKFGFLGM